MADLDPSLVTISWDAPTFKKAVPPPLTIDLHIDVPWKFTRYGLDNLMSSPFQVDTPRMKQGRLRAAFFAIYLSDKMQHEEGDEISRELVEDQIYFLTGKAQRSVATCRTIADIDKCYKSFDIVPVFLCLEGGRLIQNSLTRLAEFAKAGIKYLTLTHNFNTEWADSATDATQHNGLTHFGKSVIKECEKLKVFVDVSHSSDATAFAAISAASKPVLATHSGCREILNHPRNVSDELIKEIAGTGGLIGIPFARNFIGQSKTDITKHIDHVAQLVGAKHIAIGSDLDGAAMVDGVRDVSNWYEVVVSGLKDLGFTQDDIDGVAGRNMARLMEAQDGQTA